ncbi:MAG: hypothetical protein HQM10_05635 [Candidatus Riflebacteria bacterium]|nr:hypothetical protein [Candidatus Riflebacteria bacterium]
MTILGTGNRRAERIFADYYSPLIQPYDTILITHNPAKNDLKPGSIVIWNYNIERVCAVENDLMQIKDKTLFVNGKIPFEDESITAIMHTNNKIKISGKVAESFKSIEDPVKIASDSIGILFNGKPLSINISNIMRVDEIAWPPERIKNLLKN